MKVVFCLLITVLFAVCGCVPRRGVLSPAAVVDGHKGIEPPTWQEITGFGATCTAVQAAHWEEQALNDPRALLYGSACLISLAEAAATGQDQFDAAERSRRLAAAAAAADRWPKNAAAHYLLAYATGLVAEQRPLQALELVPLIEGEAQLAAELDGTIDHGGPDRMLGELYLRAPGFPVSLGDSSLAGEHYRRAVHLAPEKPANRLGLVEALLVEEQLSAACGELSTLFAMLASETAKDDWHLAIELQQRLCRQLQ